MILFCLVHQRCSVGESVTSGMKITSHCKVGEVRIHSQLRMHGVNLYSVEAMVLLEMERKGLVDPLEAKQKMNLIPSYQDHR